MRRLGSTVEAIGLALTLSAGPASAGDDHSGGTLVCGECHTNGKALSRQDANSICLSCHGTTASAAPGVLEVNLGGLPRQAGALNGPDGLYHFTGHTLGSPDRAPGGTWSPGAGGLVCTDCHGAHGEPAQHRNLVLRPGTAETDRRITYGSGSTNDRTKDVWLRRSTTMAERYAPGNVRFNQPDPTRSAYAAWCQGCHTLFHGAAGAVNMGGMVGGDAGRPWERHPTVGVTVGARGERHASFARYASLTNRVPTLSRSGTWPAPDNAVSCMSCHKAHGNRNPFGLLYASGRGQLTEEGDTGGRTLCRSLPPVPHSGRRNRPRRRLIWDRGAEAIGPICPRIPPGLEILTPGSPILQGIRSPTAVQRTGAAALYGWSTSRFIRVAADPRNACSDDQAIRDRFLPR